jgi:hypothetical protein
LSAVTTWASYVQVQPAPSMPCVGLVDEYVRMASNGMPNDGMPRSRSVRTNAPVAVLTDAPRSAWPPTVRPSTLGQAQPAACAAGIPGGTTVVRGTDGLESGEVSSVPSGRCTVTDTVYCRPSTSVQPSAAPKLRQNSRGVLHRDRSLLASVTDRCSSPVATSRTVANHWFHDVGSLSTTSALKYTTSDVSPSRNPGRRINSLAPVSRDDALLAFALALALAFARRAFSSAVGWRGLPADLTAGGTTGTDCPAAKPWLGCASAGKGRSTGFAPAGATGAALAGVRELSGMARITVLMSTTGST